MTISQTVAGYQGSQLFLNRLESTNLREDSVRGGAVSMVAEALNHIIRVASIVILARYLLPEDFGLLAMVTALTIVAERFKDLGLDVATIQRDRLTQPQVSSLFWVNTGAGAAIALVVGICAPVIVSFYGEPRLWAVTLAIATTFVFSGATIQHQALMRRQMRFKTIAVIGLASSLLGFVTALTLAVAGFGYWALIWREIARTVSAAVCSWVLFPWRPSSPGRFAGIERMLRTGGSVTAFNLLYFLSRNLDQVLIGRMWGAAPLGFYRQAHQLLMLPLSLLQFPVNAVALPVLSRLKHDPQRYRKYYREIVATLSFISLPLVMYLWVHAEALIVVALGERWLPTAKIFEVMALSGFAWPITCLVGAMMIGFGRNRHYVWLGVVQAFTLTIAFAIGTWWGPLGTATAFAVWTYATLIPTVWFSLRGTPVTVRDSLVAVTRPAVATCATYIFIKGALGGIWPVGGAAELMASFPVFAGCYILAWLVLPGGRATLIQYLEYATALIRRRGIAV